MCKPKWNNRKIFQEKAFPKLRQDKSKGQKSALIRKFFEKSNQVYPY